MVFRQRCHRHHHHHRHRRHTITTTILLWLMTVTVIGIDNQVACWPMVELPSPSTSPSSSPASFTSTSTSTSTSDELDSDTSRKVLGSSVVTSVSVVMNSSDGKSNTSTSSTTPASASAMGAIAVNANANVASSTSLNSTATSATTTSTKPGKPWPLHTDHDVDDGRMDSAELKSNLIASPGNFLNPDKYEFYTFDEAGDLVKRLMTWDEIQGLIAASDTDGLLSDAVVPMYYNENANANGNGNGNGNVNTVAAAAAAAVADKLHDTHLTANEFQSSDIQDVRKVVESVQNVLKSELAAASTQSKIIPIAAAVKPSSAHSPNWSSLFLPNFLENLDEDAFVDLQQHHQHHLLSDDSGAGSGASTTASVVRHSSPFEKFANHSVANTATSPLQDAASSSHNWSTITTTTTTSSSMILATANTNTNSNSNSYSEKVASVAQIRHSASATPAATTTTTQTQQKFTAMKNTTAKPSYFKYTAPSSSTSERIWPPPNALVSNEKPPTKHFFRPTASAASLSSPPWSSSTYSRSPQSTVTSWPMKSHPTTTTTTPKMVSAAASENSTFSHYTPTPAAVTTNRDSFTAALTNLLSQMSGDQQQTAKIRPNIEAFVRDSSPTTATTAIATATATTTAANTHRTSYYGQHNASVTNSNSIQFVDRQKNNASHHQPWSSSSSSSSLKNSIAHTEKTSIWQSITAEATPSSFQYTRRNSNTTTSQNHNHNHHHHYPQHHQAAAGDSAATTKTSATSPYHEQQLYNDNAAHNHHANNNNYANSADQSASSSPSSSAFTIFAHSSSSSSSAVPSWHKQSASHSPSGADSYFNLQSNVVSWKNNGTNGGVATSTSPTTAGKFGQFSSHRTATTATSSTLSTNNAAVFTAALSSVKQQQQHSQDPSYTTTTSAEPLVTWTSTYGSDDQRIDNKISQNGQILDSDKLVTEQYVSGSAAATTTPTPTTSKHIITGLGGSASSLSHSHSQYTQTQVASSRPPTADESYSGGTKKTTIWSGIGDDRTNLYVVDAKNPITQTTAALPSTIKSPQSPAPISYHNWFSVTTAQPTASSIQQHQHQQPNVYTHRINTVVNNNNNLKLNLNHDRNDTNVESKTTITSNSNSHHQQQQQQQQQLLQHQTAANYNRNSTATAFTSYYHRERPSGGGSTPSADTTVLKYTKNPAVNATSSNEMVMQRIPTLDPPNKISLATNDGADADAVAGIGTGTGTGTVPVRDDASSSSWWATKPTAAVPAAMAASASQYYHHSSTESVKNLTQIAVMVNKSNDTRATTKYSSTNNNKNTETKYRPTAKPNPTQPTSTLLNHDLHLSASSAAATAANDESNPNTSNKHNTNTTKHSIDQDKTQQTVKPINVEFLNDCITSLISNSIVSTNGGEGGGGGGGNNDRETWQSLSYNGYGNVSNVVANASHNKHFQHHHHPHHPHHPQVDDSSDHKYDSEAGSGGNEDQDEDEREHDYHRTTVTNYGNIFSHGQKTTSTNKYNSGSNAGGGGGGGASAFAAAHPAVASAWDTFQQKVTSQSQSPSTAATAFGEKFKENSHIYYYKLPPVNLQSSNTNANAPAHSPQPTAYNVNSSASLAPTGTAAAAAAAAATATATRPTNLNDRTYQKVTTVVRPSSSSSSSSSSPHFANELADTSRNDWKHNSASTMAATGGSASWTTFKSSSHTEARIGGGDASTAVADGDNAENREASATAFDQMVDTKSSPLALDELRTSTKRNDDQASAYNVDVRSTSTGAGAGAGGDDDDDVDSAEIKSSTTAWTTTNSNNATTKRTEPMATPQMVTASLNLSTAPHVAVTVANANAVADTLNDFRKEYVSQHGDNSTEGTVNDDDDDDDDDDDSGGDSNGDDDVDDGNDDGNYNNGEGVIDKNENKDEKVQSENGDQDDRQKFDHTSAIKNQFIANLTAPTQFAQFHRRTTTTTTTTAASESSPFTDRTRNNVVNKHFTTANQQRSTTPWPSMQSQKKPSPSAQSINDSVADTSAAAAAATTTAAIRVGAGASTADDDVQFVRVKLENRTTATPDADVAWMSAAATAAAAAVNKHKDEKLKTTFVKSQTPKPGTLVWTTTTGTATVTAATNTAGTPISNSASIFRSPASTSTSSTVAATAATVAVAAAAVAATTSSTNGNVNANPTSTAVELHPAPHENMGLEASVAYLGDDVKTFIDLCNELSFKIWTTQTGKSLTTSRSIVLSPFALLSTLAMIFLGARGSSSGIMNDFLRLDDMVTFNPHQVFRNITESAIAAKNTGAANVAFVRQVFSDKTKGNVLEFYKERLQQYYDTYVEEINFNAIGDLVRKRTNLLVKRQTQGRIQDYLRGSSITMKPPLATFTANIFQTDCSAASTEGRDGEMYFVVRPSTRQRRLVPIPAVVYRGGGFLAGYEPGLDATAVTLSPESIISTILVLPGQQGQVAPGDGLARLEQRLLESSYRRGAWSRLLRSLLFRHGLEVQIPRFSHKSIVNLTAGLQKMGMGEIFAADKADLRGINGLLNELHLSDCVQANTFSTCGEESVGARHHVETFPSFGQRASAARFQHRAATTSSSSLSPSLSSRPRQARLPDNPRLRFDRPFLYMVRHNPTGMILYIGRFNPRLLP